MALSQQAPAADANQSSRPWTGAAELNVVHARGLDDAQAVIALVRGQATVVLNVAALDTRLRTRVTDIIRGGLCAIDGRATEIGSHVWLLKPVLAR